MQEQTRRSSSPLKVALLDQIDKMARVNHPLRGWGFLGAARERSAVERNNRVMAEYLTPAIRARWQKLCAAAPPPGDDHDDDAGPGGPGGRETKRTTVVDLALQTLDPEKGDAAAAPSHGAGGLDADFLDLLLANTKVFLFAGHDTTASTLCWLVKLLAAHPRALARLRAEHDAVLGPLGAAGDDDDGLAAVRAAPRRLDALPYTRAVIKETLRLYPLVGTMRQGRPGFALVDAARARAYDTAGWVLWDATPIVQRRPDVWPRGDEFVPERWLATAATTTTTTTTAPEAHREGAGEGEDAAADDDARLRRQQKSAWRPFGQGPRNCIGQELAMTELRLVTVLLARRFDIEEAWEAWDATRWVTIFLLFLFWMVYLHLAPPPPPSPLPPQVASVLDAPQTTFLTDAHPPPVRIPAPTPRRPSTASAPTAWATASCTPRTACRCA